jgi:hypothetical protein
MALKAPRQRPQNLGELLLNGSTGLWASDGPLMVARQAKAVEEEDTQTTPSNLY